MNSHRKFKLQFTMPSNTISHMQQDSPYYQTQSTNNHSQFNELSLANPKRNCQRCLELQSAIQCFTCNNRYYCHYCYNNVHKIGKFQFHIIVQKEDKNNLITQLSPNKIKITKKKHLKAKTKCFESQQSIVMVQQMQKNHQEMLEREIHQIWDKIIKDFKQSSQSLLSALKNKCNIIELEIQERKTKEIQHLRQKVKNSYHQIINTQQSNIYSPRKQTATNYYTNKKEIKAKHLQTNQLIKYYTEYKFTPISLQEIQEQINSLDVKKIIQTQDEEKTLVNIHSSKNLRYNNCHKVSDSNSKMSGSTKKIIQYNQKSSNKTQLHHNYITSRKSIPIIKKTPLQASTANYQQRQSQHNTSIQDNIITDKSIINNEKDVENYFYQKNNITRINDHKKHKKGKTLSNHIYD